MIKDFKIKNIFYIFSTIFTIIYHCIWIRFDGGYQLYQTFLFLNILIYCNLAMIDCRYFEISGKSYYFFILPILGYMFLNPLYSPLSLIISFIMVLLLMMLSDKIIGIEKIGGADVKLLLTMSFLFSYYEILTIVFIIFLVNLLLLIFIKGIYMIIKKYKNLGTVKIPMIVSIFLSVVILQYLCYFKL